MLKRFSVTGFKNFENKTTIDFSDVREYKFNTGCVTNGLLNTAIIYGKNAVGKSNFGLALYDIVSHLTMNNIVPESYEYYLNQHETESASFEYVFRFNDDEIVYRYKKTDSQDLFAEHLELNSQVLLSTESFCGSSGPNLSRLEHIAPTLNWDNLEHLIGKSYLRFFLSNSAIEKSHPLIKMRDFINNMVLFRGQSESEFTGHGGRFMRTSPRYYDFIFDHVDEFNDLLRVAEISIQTREIEDPDGKTRLYFDTVTPMPFFKVASNGTKALYNFFYWYKTAPDVSFMYIDEFDAFYHYELAETIVGMLEKMSNFQKILTSHNTNLLSNRIMRPDCYFILTSDKLTSLANATERELREGHNLEKLYKAGFVKEVVL